MWMLQSVIQILNFLQYTMIRQNQVFEIIHRSELSRKKTHEIKDLEFWT